MEKRGLEKKAQVNWYLIISLILGILILIIAVYWIFQEYFSGDDAGKELCRQSIILRDKAPETSILFKDFSLKEAFPLKCKTDVVNIDYKNTKQAEQEIADALASCWWLLGEGKFKILAHDSSDIQTGCFICARIHILDDEKVKAYYRENSTSINLRDTIYLKMSDGKTYYDYLNKGEVSAIPFKTIEGSTWSKKNEFEVRSGGHTTSGAELAGAGYFWSHRGCF